MSKFLRISDLCQIAIFVAVITICSWISIPFTYPITLQIFAVFTACSYLGFKRGIISVSVYLMLGIVGIPVFAGFQGGIGHILGVTGGFLIGFIIAATIIGIFINKNSGFIRMFLFMLLALIGCYIFGISWLIITSSTLEANTFSVIATSFLSLFLIDIIKILLAALVVCKLNKIERESFK